MTYPLLLRNNLRKLRISTAKSTRVSRYFSYLDPIQQGYYTFQNTLVFASGDTFEFDFLAPSSVVSGDQYITDGGADDATRAHIRLRSSGAYAFSSGLTATVNGVTKVSGDLYPTDGALHKVICTFTTTKAIKYLGCRLSIENFYSGILSSAKSTISGAISSWRLDKDPLTTTEQSSGGGNILTRVNVAQADVELFTLNTATTPDQWENPDQSTILQVAP